MTIETAVSVPYQMEPLLSGNRGAVTVVLPYLLAGEAKDGVIAM
jgi:hypothetical protein